ncbi:hypothetical protein I302_106441 [Kwoniella bestiolae CBS 10118]|uniref:AB hydrolase-1 domain-containing protein n=1 Tax=Kwoniella bestiolae CBS 10118 TaxID=1296100 RepID=A0A1B9G1F0_9TREE|nr:hypothetical protein I302_06302 [Kwoniella bestiolae CBS 10118]OCF24841.1 hypothetical protein I302_06302 [Kwoniella bestiolae CBS 10118]
MTTYKSIQLSNGFNVAYIEAGNPSNSTTLLLLHGFPSSSNQFRNLIPFLSNKYHIIAPDLPAFGLTTVPDDFEATFATLAEVVGELLDVLDVKFFIPYVFDYGAPTGYRLALQRPEAFKGLIIQNGNAYEAGLSAWWDPLRGYWKTEKGSEEWLDSRGKLARAIRLEDAKEQYVSGLSAELASRVDPNTYTLDYLLNLAPEEKAQRQLDLFYDYQNNVELYPKFHEFFKKYQLPTLILWGKNDQYFPLPGAHAYLTDLPNAQLKVFEDGAHFLLETHVQEVARSIKDFLERENLA